MREIGLIVADLSKLVTGWNNTFVNVSLNREYSRVAVVVAVEVMTDG